jgi:hypothetical protein
MVNVGIFYEKFCGHLVQFMADWYSLWSFVVFFPIWNVWTKKNLATLLAIISTFATKVEQCRKISSEKKYQCY